MMVPGPITIALPTKEPAMHRPALRFATFALPALLAACATGSDPARSPAPLAKEATTAAPDLPLRAGGNEPGWNLEIGEKSLRLTLDYGQRVVTIPAPRPDRSPGATRYAGSDGGKALAVTVLDRTCADTMTGMPRPATVEVSFDGRALKGCGGDPVSLLRGGVWLVSHLGGQPIVAKSRLTLAFGANGRVTGTASCNTYSAGYLLTGEGVTITMPISTMRACEAPYMAQESIFLEVLRGVNRFERSPDGVLTLHAADGGTITARREVTPVATPKKPARPR